MNINMIENCIMAKQLSVHLNGRGDIKKSKKRKRKKIFFTVNACAVVGQSLIPMRPVVVERRKAAHWPKVPFGSFVFLPVNT